MAANGFFLFPIKILKYLITENKIFWHLLLNMKLINQNLVKHFKNMQLSISNLSILASIKYCTSSSEIYFRIYLTYLTYLLIYSAIYPSYN